MAFEEAKTSDHVPTSLGPQIWVASSLTRTPPPPP
jgi:hypothetical protein